METDTGGRRVGMVPMGLEEADSQDDLRRGYWKGEARDVPMGLGEAGSQEDDLWRRILEGGG